MTCSQVQSLIIPFIENELTIQQLEEFTDHLQECDSCMEELEVYYTLLIGMKQLDEDLLLSNDFHKDLLNKIKSDNNKIKKHKREKLQTTAVVIILITLILILITFQLEKMLFNEEPQEELINEINYTIQHNISQHESEIHVFENKVQI